MLYVTTRTQNDAHTAFKTLISDTASDGGCFIPFRTPIFDQNELNDLLKQGFGEIVASILNRLFSANLTGWTVDFSVGRNCIKSVVIGQKAVIAQLWHNPERQYDSMEKALFSLIGNGHTLPPKTSRWARIAIRFAVLFGLYSEMLDKDIIQTDEEFDISVPVDDFTSFMAAWYARETGMPIRMILCGSDKESGIWDFIQRGEINTHTLSDSLAQGIENLIYGKWGKEACAEFVSACNTDTTYAVSEEMPKLSDSCFCSVVGANRVLSVINSVYRTDTYLIDKKTALPYAAVQDFRAKTGENRITLILANDDPMLSWETIAEATGLSKESMKDLPKK